jgi:hypothetical protein
MRLIACVNGGVLLASQNPGPTLGLTTRRRCMRGLRYGVDRVKGWYGDVLLSSPGPSWLRAARLAVALASVHPMD